MMRAVRKKRSSDLVNVVSLMMQLQPTRKLKITDQAVSLIAVLAICHPDHE